MIVCWRLVLPHLIDVVNIYVTKGPPKENKRKYAQEQDGDVFFPALCS